MVKRNLTQCITYEQAKTFYETNGVNVEESAEQGTLGVNKGLCNYSVQLKGSAVEFSWRGTIITYKPNGDVFLLVSNCYSNIIRNQFIKRLLNVNCKESGKYTVIKVGLGRRCIVCENQTLILRNIEGDWKIIEQPEIYGYQLNRIATKKIRTRHSEFIDFAHKELKNRTEQVIPKRSEKRIKPYEAISLSEMELGRLGISNIKRDYGELFQSFIRIGQPASTKHLNYLRAVMLSAAYLRDPLLVGDNGDAAPDVVFQSETRDVVKVLTNSIVKQIDAFLLRPHLNEVLVWRKLAPGVVPNRKYYDWIPANWEATCPVQIYV